jgi:hypothetical protein
MPGHLVHCMATLQKRTAAKGVSAGFQITDEPVQVVNRGAAKVSEQENEEQAVQAIRPD